jgi:uncharacterized protein YqjF (DUF2071 family)
MGPAPEETVGVPLLQQQWDSIAFIHWPYSPALVRPLLPPGLELDTFEGQAWLGMTPFVARATRPWFLPAGPFSTFPETNLRTYVTGPDGRDGIWFFTLEAANPLMAAIGPATLGIPYRWAAMSVDIGRETIYRSRRLGGGRGSHLICVRIGGSCRQTAFDHYLTGRWRAYSRAMGRLLRVSVEHEPWSLHEADVSVLEEDLRVASGIPAAGRPPVVHWSPGVNARLGSPRLV